MKRFWHWNAPTAFVLIVTMLIAFGGPTTGPAIPAGEKMTTTASGLVIPDTAKEKPQEGTVVAVGPGRFDDGVRVPMDVKVGDVVLYSKYGGTEIKHGGEDLLVLSARDILAVIEK